MQRVLLNGQPRELPDIDTDDAFLLAHAAKSRFAATDPTLTPARVLEIASGHMASTAAQMVLSGSLDSARVYAQAWQFLEDWLADERLAEARRRELARFADTAFRLPEARCHCTSREACEHCATKAGA